MKLADALSSVAKHATRRSIRSKDVKLARPQESRRPGTSKFAENRTGHKASFSLLLSIHSCIETSKLTR